MEQTDINHSMDARRFAKEQGQKLDQAAGAVQGLMQPIMQLWATSLSIQSDNLAACANLIERWSGSQQSYK